MKIRKMFLITTCAAFFLSSFIPLLHAQKQDFRIKKVNVTYQRRTKTQSFSSGLGSLSGTSSRQKWAVVEVLYESKPAWTNEITMTYHVLLNNKNNYVVLSDSYTYLSIKRAPQHFDAIYVHPNIIDRYGKVEAVAVEIWKEGALEDRKLSTSKIKNEWWNEHRVIKNLLRVVFYTPFILDDPGKYEMLKID